MSDSAQDVHPAGGIEPFVAKYRGAWPEWAIAEVFVPVAERERASAWLALQFEWQEAAWGGSDPRPGEAKLGWWMEELHGWSQGRRRHPLGTALQGASPHWGAMAAALPSLQGSRERPRDAAESRAALEPAAQAAAAVEASLFRSAADASAVTHGWLHARLARHAEGALPLQAMTAADPAAAWRDELLSQWPRMAGGPVARRIELALARRRLARGDAAAPLAPWTALYTGWRAARD